MFTVLATVQAAYQNSLPSVETCAMVNLVQGTLQANSVTRGGNIDPLPRNVSKAYVNFNGGTFMTRVNGNLFGNAPADNDKTWIDFVTVYAGGATVKTDAASRIVYLRTPLRAPNGKGIASIAYRGKKTGFIAPPVVIIDGDGEGASAYAVFDAAKGEVTGIRVVSPGWGYTWATAQLVTGALYNYTAKAVSCPVELADATSGGLTKEGPGTLVLAAANTYEGETVLKGGTLELGAADALPSASAVAYEGGALVSAAAVFPMELKVRIPGAENGSVRRCTLATFTDSLPASLPSVEVVNAPETEKTRWVAMFNGLSLRVARQRGVVISVR